jgi:hypothetical protein
MEIITAAVGAVSRGCSARPNGHPATTLTEALESRQFLAATGLPVLDPAAMFDVAAPMAMSGPVSGDVSSGMTTQAALAVTIPDSNLLAAIRLALSIPTGDTTFNTNDPNAPTATLNMDGTVILPGTLQVTDTAGPAGDRSVALPDTVVGSTSAAAVFTLTNIGQLPLQINNLASGGTNPGDFLYTVKEDFGNTITQGNSFILMPGVSFTVDVALHPASAGAKSATLVFTTNDVTAASVTLTMTGTAVTPAALVVTDNKGSATDKSVVLPSTPLGIASAPAVFTLTNTGQQALTFTSPVLAGTDAADFQYTVKDNTGAVVSGTSFSIPAGLAWQIEVRLLSASAGAKYAALGFGTNDVNNPAVSLFMSGTAFVSATLAVTDNSGVPIDGRVTLPDTAVGTVGSSRTFVLSSTGIQPLDITDFALGGTNPAEINYTISDQNGQPVTGTSFSIPTGSAYTVDVAMHPVSAGWKIATISFNSNDNRAPSVNLLVNGNAVPLHLALRSGATLAEIPNNRPQAIGFSTTTVGQTGPTREFQIRNAGTKTLKLSALRLPKGFQSVQSLPSTRLSPSGC